MTAFLFPGQGTQRENMYSVFLPYENIVSEIFEAASDASGKNVKELCSIGSEEELSRTENTQIAVGCMNCAFLKVLEYNGVYADITAGHSLGQFSALVCARTLSVYDGFKLIAKRAKITGAIKEKGVLCSIIGLDVSVLRELCEETGACIALCNSPLQTVIGGTKEKVEAAAEKAMALGALKTQILAVSNAFHTYCMKEAEAEFSEYVRSIHFDEPQCKLLLNCTGTYANGSEDIREDVINQLCHTVLWNDCMNILSALSPVTVEVGMGNVLAGLLKKHDRKLRVYSAENLMEKSNISELLS